MRESWGGEGEWEWSGAQASNLLNWDSKFIDNRPRASFPPQSPPGKHNYPSKPTPRENFLDPHSAVYDNYILLLIYYQLIQVQQKVW